MVGTQWSYTAALTNGSSYHFKVTETDLADNTGNPTADFVIISDTTAPSAATGLSEQGSSRLADSYLNASEAIDHGDTRFKDETHLWVFMDLPGRFDNLVCVVLVLEAVVVFKTMMHYFDLED